MFEKSNPMRYFQYIIEEEINFYQKYPYFKNKFSELKKHLNTSELIITHHRNLLHPDSDVEIYELSIRQSFSTVANIAHLIIFKPLDDKKETLFENSTLIFNQSVYDYFFNQVFLKGDKKDIKFHENNSALRDNNEKSLMFSTGLSFDFYQFFKEDIDKHKKDNKISYQVNVKVDYCRSFYDLTNRDVIPTYNSFLVKLSNSLTKNITINDFYGKLIKQDVLLFWNDKNDKLRFNLISFLDYFIKTSAETYFKTSLNMFENLYKQNFIK